MSSLKSVLQKLTSINSKPNAESFPELPTCVVWIRCAIAIAYGSWLGLGTQRGGAGIIMGLNLVAFLPFMYCSTFLMADIESYGSKILFSGVLNAICLLLLIWMYFYTLEHEDDEKLIVSALLGAMSSDSAASDGNPIVSDASTAEDSEF